ncbi:WD40 repeat-like-containing domain protein [Metarhizium album ARSEF 1941]|uniref:WD40 repeat-like-containing domain protein n=1 Tax=Metarhizium album (strain ARSEF 1941) TaxID=1081103 RepID=A0A0B2WHL8_METAS|nr:WD40 repeat-like-containing domain protein [Metarhizium album ARSEF 1941]KHN95511.1 WD40 repeat-like-containing domain protein [Metarhizium album ARSEF 1941]
MDLPPAPTPPVNSGVMPSNTDRTASLLNLLKFSSGAGSSNAQLQQQHQKQHQHAQQSHHQQQSREPSYSQAQYSSPPTRILQPAPAGADPTGLLAALMRGAHDSHDTDDESRQAAPTAPGPAPGPAPAGHETAQHTQPANANPFANGSPSADTRSFLLNLLNRPKPSQTDQPVLTETPRSNGAASQSPEITTDSNRFFNQYQHQQAQPQLNAYLQQAQQHAPSQYQPHQPSDSYNEAHRPVSNSSSYAYQQQQSQDSPADMSALFQQIMGSLTQSSPQSHTSQPAAHPPQPPFQILKKGQSSPTVSQPRAGSEHSPVASPPDQNRHATNRTSSLHLRPSTSRSPKQTSSASASASFESSVSVQKYKETVGETVDDLDDQILEGVQEALGRAEHGFIPAGFAEDEQLKETSAGQEWPSEVAHADIVKSVEEEIVRNIKDDLEKEDVYRAAETLYINDASDSANAIRENARCVADSWESAEVEETIEVEETELPQVRVYKFPQEPWNSISLKEETDEIRPEFRDESTMDIARLKKEFDQVDRNLFTASQTYMTYGMSKLGGLRVIRQDDGKDAKVFTDTKDRIFNVAISVTPPESGNVHREAIIGTGVGGAVYWVLIKDGEKDHIEDPHLEQYGFALPPISSHDGDAPGGLLKTRARASTAHPEFFAVGRGKSINFIWPAYILQQKLFRAGHDRVVDTEALLAQSSLKINTGKAGKDFTFSQDDSVVVSLDKSGRVKFWDVRQLTKAKEDSDYRYPLPAQSSLEVKDPLLTLATTPEGEKAWPTSVLLLDRKKAYEQRGPLRYMVVGMKQNHTLQVWDLALGKAVQELNLPHSKESDAVCSVMYHPASGMIVIGHPTRNSVYFAHFSAPKYSLESISQVDYIEKLLLPLKPNEACPIRQPSSTAIISGFREYSFANRGVLRSLDILYTPITKQATAQTAGQDTKEKDRLRFELYAMHSKGVACVLVKKSDLGGSDNTLVLDAVKEGLVTVSDFNKPQPVNPAHGGNQQAKNPTHRAATKQSPSQQPTSTVHSDATQRGADAVTPANPNNEAKETETPAQSSKEGQVEKPERKSRKKKGNAAAKEAEAGANGATNSTRGTQDGRTESAAKTNNAAAVASGVTLEVLDSTINVMQTRLTSAVSDALKSSFKSLQGKIDEGGRLRDENFNQHQVKLLDMVSEVLNENTQKVLESLIHHQFTELLVPAIGEKATKAVSDVVQHKLQPNVASAVQKEIQNALPQALNRSLRSVDFATAIAERVGASVNTTVQQEMAATLSQRLTPTLRNLATHSAQQAVAEVHQQYSDKFERMQSQQVSDSNKIDQLLSYVSTLTDMVSTMAASQSSLQAEFLKLKQQPVHELPGVSGLQRQTSPGFRGFGPQGGYSNSGFLTGPNPHQNFASYQTTQPRPSPPYQQRQQQYVTGPDYLRGGQYMGSPHDSTSQTDLTSASKMASVGGAFANSSSNVDTEVDKEVHEVEMQIKEDKLQEALLKWIKGGYQKEVFQRCLSLHLPSRFEHLPPVLLLAAIGAISKDLDVNNFIKQRIDWIEMAVRSIDRRAAERDWKDLGHAVVKQAYDTICWFIGKLNTLMEKYDNSYPKERRRLEWIVGSSEHILQTLDRSQR